MNSEKITHSRNFEKRPFWFSALNNTWKATYFLGTETKLDKDEMIRSARKITGLNDLGKDFSDEPLEQLLTNAHTVRRGTSMSRIPQRLTALVGPFVPVSQTASGNPKPYGFRED